MPRVKYTYQEFAEFCGVNASIIAVNVQRKKIVRDQDNMILISDPVNVSFKKRRDYLQTDAGQATIEGAATRKRGQLKNEKLTAAQKEVKKLLKAEAKKKTPMEIWREKKIIADAKKAQYEAELKAVQLEKAMGKVIPIELLHTILKINIQHIFIGFENELQNIASVYCDVLAGGDRGRLAEIISKMRDVLERIIKRTEESADKEIELAVDEFAEVRSRGESKV